MAEITADKVVLSPYPKQHVPDCDLWHLFEKSCCENLSKTAIIDPMENKTLTFQQVLSLTEVISENLLKIGYDPKTTLCIYMSNCVEYVLTIFATWRIGGKVVVMNQLLTKTELHKQLQDVDSSVIVCNKTTAVRAIEGSHGTNVKKIICKENFDGCLSYSKLTIPCQKSQIVRKRIHPIDLEQTAIILFSSGTTGAAKGVELTHHALISNYVSFRYASGVNSNHNGCVVYQTFSHAYGIVLIILYLLSGQKLIIMQKFDMEQYIALVSRHKVDKMFFVPPIAVQFCKGNLATKYDLSCVKVISTGAAALSTFLEAEMERIMGKHVKIIQGFGMTEACACCMRMYPFHEIATVPQGSVGWPISNSQAKVVDMITGKNLGHGKTGEVCFKSGFLMKGYLNNPEATANAIDKEGWLHTGDIGYYDHQGFFFIVDRLKEMIKYKGYQVPPNELETALLSHPAVADAGVSAILDFEAGELPFAWVVLKQGSNITENQLHQFINEKVAPYKKLRGGIKFVSEIPRSVSGKILRRTMREKEQSRLNLKAKF